MILPLWAKPAMAAVALLGAFSAGWTVNGWRWETRQADALRDAQIAFQKKLDKQQDEAEAYEREREQARVDSRTRQETIRTIYRDIEVPVECAAPDAVRGVLDDAVRQSNARAAGEPGASVPAPAGPPRSSR